MPQTPKKKTNTDHTSTSSDSSNPEPCSRLCMCMCTCVYIPFRRAVRERCRTWAASASRAGPRPPGRRGAAPDTRRPSLTTCRERRGVRLSLTTRRGRGVSLTVDMSKGGQNRLFFPLSRGQNRLFFPFSQLDYQNYEDSLRRKEHGPTCNAVHHTGTAGSSATTTVTLSPSPPPALRPNSP